MLDLLVRFSGQSNAWIGGQLLSRTTTSDHGNSCEAKRQKRTEDTHLSGRRNFIENRFYRLLEKSYGLLARNSGELFQELIQRLPSLQVIHQVSHRHARAREHRSATKYARIANDNRGLFHAQNNTTFFGLITRSLYWSCRLSWRNPELQLGDGAARAAAEPLLDPISSGGLRTCRCGGKGSRQGTESASSPWRLRSGSLAAIR